MATNLNIKAVKQNTYDAIVVGSGISGGWAAKELCEKGLQTLVLERGRQVEHIKDYPTADLKPWELPYANRLTQQDQQDYYIQKNLTFMVKQDVKHFFVKDSENPYVQEKPFSWYRGYQVGGKSLMWSRHVFRWSDLDFEANAKEGIGIDWPIRYADIKPWYEHIERFIGVSGENSNLPQLPNQILQPPFEMNCFEKHIRDSMQAKFKDRKLISSAQAVLSRPHNGRGPCQARNLCARGCPYGAYFSSNSVTLPAAAKTGNLTLRPDSIVHSLIYDEQKNRAIGVRVIDTQTREMVEYFAKVIFLNAGTLNSTLILLNSTSSRFPNGLGNDSGVLGHYLMDHHTESGAMGGYSGLADKYYYGRRSTSVYIPRFRNVGEKDRHPDFVRGYGYEMYTSRANWSRGNDMRGFGAAFKDEICRPGEWFVYTEAYGECLPYYDNRVSIDRKNTDPWGMPMLKIDCHFRENEIAMRKQMQKDAEEMLAAANLDWIEGFNRDVAPGGVIHEMGTARMGRDPKDSFLNAFNQSHSVRNLFVTDGACMTSTACQNPSLTYMALTARACDYAVREQNPL